ncbi:MAG: tripartite tricarboxylate transporter substrate-binding protein [Beijerinckiaceae bacterium]|nr:tripartite tricarboxylate transporter substrate-binding protein [Beijerinckiaceae bacterium]
MVLRMRAVDIVEDAGFLPVESVNAGEAIEILESRSDIAQLSTGIQMTGSMDGLMLAHAVHRRWPKIKMCWFQALSPLRIWISLKIAAFPKPPEMKQMIGELRAMVSASVLKILVVVFCAGLCTFSGRLAAADPIADFYKGKQVTLVVGATAGGGYDLYARLVGRHIGRRLPGNPTVVVANMPGAGGNTSAAYVANVAAKDGTVIGAVQTGTLLDQLISPNAAQIKHDARTLNYIGSANSEVFTCLVDASLPIKSFADLFEQEIIFGSSGGTTRDMPVALKSILGARIKLIPGYGGTREIGMAIERKEVSGLCGMGWTSIQSQRPDWFEKKLVRVLVQESAVGDPALNRQGVPLSVSFAKNAEQRLMLELLYSQGVFTRPFIMAPEAPKERVTAMREAFVDALSDPQAHAEATKQKLVITIINGQDLQEMVRKIYTTPAATIEKLKRALASE